MSDTKGSKHSSEDLKAEVGDVSIEKVPAGVALDAHYDPKFVSRTL